MSASSSSMPVKEVQDSDKPGDDEKTRQDIGSEPVAPDGGWGWLVVLGSFLVYFIADGCVYSFGVFYNELLEYFGDSKVKTAVIPAMLYGFPLLLSPFVCALVNSFGCRLIGMIGGVLVGLGFLISYFAISVEFLIVSLGVCCSIGLQMSYIAAIMSVTYYFDTKRGLATGLAVAGSGIGTFAFAPIFEALILTYAWRGASLIMAGICFNIMTASSLFRPVATEPCCENEGGADNSAKELEDNKDSAKENLIPMVQLHRPEDEDVDSIKPSKLMVLADMSESKIVLVSREGSECDQMSQASCPSVEGSADFAKDSNISLESEQCPESGDWCKKEGKLLPIAVDRRLVGEVVSMSASELLNVPGGAFDKRKFHSEQKLSKKSSSDRLTSLQDIRWHRGGSPIIFTSRTSVRTEGDTATRIPVIQTYNGNNYQWQRPCDCLFMYELKEAMYNIFDITLIKQCGFLLICLSNFMLCLWFGAPYIFIVDKAVLHGIDQLSASFLVSIIGITSTIGQVVLGFLGDKLKNCIIIYEVSMVLCGISVLLLPSCTSYWSHSLVVAVFGFFISANYSLTTLILIQAVGLERLTTAFGFLQLGQGIGTLLGTPLVGLVYDRTGSYNMAFYIAGAFICLSGFILLPLHWIVRKPKMDNTSYEEVPQRLLPV